jgi:crotonobetainyl-CoA:carnitine CoA-transferase CaiB-like acyl-CoA transferase
MSSRPLEGLRVLDLADEKGELAGRLLADLGADVLRVEPPTGARSRSLPPFHGGTSLYFAHRNSNKRGVALDLTQQGDRDRLVDLAGRADVLVEAFAPGALAERGLAPVDLVARHPHLIALSISDFGQTGPYRDWVATDATLEAIGGMQFKAGLPGKPPLLPPGALAYDVAGVMGAFAVLAALLQRRRTGHGQNIDLSVLESVAQQCDWSFSNGTYTQAKCQDAVEMRTGSGPMYRLYACKTGYVRLVILSPRQWHAMREWLGDPDYLMDPVYDSFLGRIQIADALAVMIGDLFATMPHEQVAAEAQRRGLACTPPTPSTRPASRVPPSRASSSWMPIARATDIARRRWASTTTRWRRGSGRSRGRRLGVRRPRLPRHSPACASSTSASAAWGSRPRDSSPTTAPT